MSVYTASFAAVRLFHSNGARGTISERGKLSTDKALFVGLVAIVEADLAM